MDGVEAGVQMVQEIQDLSDGGDDFWGFGVSGVARSSFRGLFRTAP
jgi:hypothetical protein